MIIRQVDVSAAAEAILARLAEEEPERRVRVVITPGLTAHTDAVLADIVLENLLGNAWKFTRRTPEASIDVTGDGRPAGGTFTVRDNGVGFDGARSDEILRPVARLHQGPDFPGTGIGLATVRRVLARLGGRCWVETAPDRGAAFHFTLGPA